MEEIILVGILAILVIFFGAQWFAVYVSIRAYILYSIEKGYKQPTREEMTAYKTVAIKDLFWKK